MPGFTGEGLVIPRQPEIIQDLIEEEKINIHPLVNTNPDVFLGQFNNVLANLSRVSYEYLEQAYNQTRLSSAEGAGLDELGSEKGVSRLLASESYVDVIVEGTNEIIIPQGSLLEDPSTKQRYITRQGKRISNTEAISAIFNTTTSAPSTAFTITINGIPYTRSTPGSGVNMVTTLGLLAGDINAAAIGVTANSTASSITLSSNTLTLTPFDTTSNTSFSMGNVQTKAKAVSVNKGSVTAATPGNWRILSPVPGWVKVSPIISTLQAGRDREEDQDYRLRIRVSNDNLGRGTTRAVKTRLRNVAGVTHADVFENTTISTVGTLPPYSIHCVVSGGDEDEIAKTIHETIGTGTTDQVGSTVIVYTDEFGEDFSVHFSRPTPVNIEVRITLVIFEEESLTDDYLNIIKTSVVEAVNNTGLGQDIIPSHLYVPIYTNVTGVNVTNIEVRVVGGPSYSNARLTIDPDKFAQTTTSNISIV